MNNKKDGLNKEQVELTHEAIDRTGSIPDSDKKNFLEQVQKIREDATKPTPIPPNSKNNPQ